MYAISMGPIGDGMAEQNVLAEVYNLSALQSRQYDLFPS